MDDTLGAFVPGAMLRLDGAASGPLHGLEFAAKDLFDVAGAVTGCGNPDWARTHEAATETAWAIRTLLEAGANLAGKTLTDELAYSLNGTSYCDASDNGALDLGVFPNTGIASLTLPNLAIARARVKVACANSIYFSLSEVDISLNGTTSTATNCKSADVLSGDGVGDLVAACSNRIGAVPAGGGVTLSSDDGGGGGALLWLPLLLALGWAGRAAQTGNRSTGG